jgi:hypothetical protein
VTGPSQTRHAPQAGRTSPPKYAPPPQRKDPAVAAPLVTAEDVRDYLRLQDSADSAWLADAAAAATDYVNGLSHVNPEEWDNQTRTGAIMLSGRLYSSRNAPLGSAGFDAMGSIVSARTDPEVARLLKIGRYTPPAIA